jgi:NAD(P)H-dependent FMN reductase
MGDSIDRAARVLVVYYSATGHVHALAKAVAEGAEQVGADVRLRHVEELAPEMLISQNQAWGRHRSEVSDEPTASLGDIEWADGIAFGTPTRFGNVAAQLKMFVDQAGHGASFTSGIRVGPPDPEAMAVAVSQGLRLARVAQVIGLAQERGLLDVQACVLPPQDARQAPGLAS